MTKARDLADLGNGVTEADIAASNSPTNGYALTAQSGNTGGLTWAETGTADDSVSEAKLQVSNAPTNGYMLTAQSGNTGGLTWAAAPTSSTAFGAVGTYIWGRPNNTTNYSGGATASSMHTYSPSNAWPRWGGSAVDVVTTAVSGTWRCMTRAYGASGDGNPGLWVRIS